MLHVFSRIIEQHDLSLITVAVAVCILSCFTTTRFLASIEKFEQVRAQYWLAGSAAAFGGGIWATHFIAVLAYEPDSMQISYDFNRTILSMVTAIVLSGIGFAIGINRKRAMIGGSVVGMAMCAMYFIGVSAIEAPADLNMDRGFTIASIVVAIALSSAAMEICHRKNGLTAVVGATATLVLAMLGLHFFGLAAFSLVPNPLVEVPTTVIDSGLMAISIACVTILVISIGWGGSLIDLSITARFAEEATVLRKNVAELEGTKAQLEHTTERLEQALAEANHIAFHDLLTGLANRARCQRDLVELISDTQEDHSFAVVQIDLDNFKRTNDTLGHMAGDYLLQVVGERLRLLADEFPDFKPYRWGGDEFVGIIRQIDSLDLKELCQDITDLMAVPANYEGATFSPTVSLGVARYPQDAKNVNDLIIFSDLALYKTKRLGRDGYQFFTDDMKGDIRRNAKIEQALRVAIANRRIEVFYQPQVSLKDGMLVGLEALARWTDDELGPISPAEFIPIGESSSMGPALGRYIFDEAMRSARQWISEGIRFGRLSINLSPTHLKRGCFLDDFFAAAEKNQVEPKYLSVEILESLFLDDETKEVSGVLTQLRERGILVELDDFGTGYASLSHLASLPIDGLKIDQSFIQGMTTDIKKVSIVQALIAISKLSGFDVICEGVEDEHQLTLLTEFDRCSIQGYLISKPMPFPAATEWIMQAQNGVLIGSQAHAAIVS